MYVGKNNLLAIDLDDSVWDHFGPLAKDIKRKTGVDIFGHKTPAYHFQDILGLSIPDSIQLVHDFEGKKSFRNLLPFLDAVIFLPKIAQLRRIEAITNRRPILESITLYQLNRHFPGVVSEVHFSKNNYAGTGKYEKWEICRARGIGEIVEDSPKNSLSCAEHGITVYFLKRRHHRPCEKHPLIVPVSGWGEIYDKIRNEPTESRTPDPRLS